MNHVSSFLAFGPLFAPRLRRPTVTMVAIAIVATCGVVLVSQGVANHSGSIAATPTSTATSLMPARMGAALYAPIDGAARIPSNATCIPLGVCVELPAADGADAAERLDRYIVG